VTVAAVIPARLGSTRFPGKALFPFKGRPLLYHVWRQVIRAKEINEVWIATDSREIARAAENFDAQVIITSRRPRTGTDRIAEAMSGHPAEIVINIQGDCVGLNPGVLDRVVRAMKHDRAIESATLVRPVRGDDELFDPSLVKVVVDRKDRALWFSRLPLPYLQRPAVGARSAQFRFLAHIGVYFFRRAMLDNFARWKRTPLEKAESLEQLRILENGGSIRVFRTAARTISIDKPEDIRKISGR
jgi:3-deoxy-manno-octulosonate cytidylyltransferase (CMP-KDO synthetase)